MVSFISRLKPRRVVDGRMWRTVGRTRSFFQTTSRSNVDYFFTNLLKVGDRVTLSEQRPTLGTHPLWCVHRTRLCRVVFIIYSVLLLLLLLRVPVLRTIRFCLAKHVYNNSGCSCTHRVRGRLIYFTSKY